MFTPNPNWDKPVSVACNCYISDHCRDNFEVQGSSWADCDSRPCQSESRMGMSRRAVVHCANSKGKMSGAWILQLAGSDFALRFYGKFCGYHIWLVGFESWDYWDTFSVTRS